MAAGHNLRGTVFNALYIADRGEDLQHKAGHGKARVVLFHRIGQGEVDQIVEVPAARAVGLFAGIGLGVQGVLRHEVAVVAQDGFGQADKRLANYQVAECRAIFEHAHEADAADVVACFVV